MPTPEKDELDRQNVTFGFNEEGPLVMVITVPLQALSDDAMNGSATLRGKFDELKSLALQKVQAMRVKKASTGVLLGKPAVVPTVH